MWRRLLLLIVIFLPVAAAAQNPVSWTLESEAKGKALKTGDKFKAKLKATIDGEWHLYSVDQPEGGPFPTTIKSLDASRFALDGQPKPASAPISKFDPNFKIDTKFFARSAGFDVGLAAVADGPADELALSVKYQVCNDTTCLPPREVKVTFAGFEDIKKSALATAPAAAAATPAAEPAASDSRNPTSEISNPSDLPLTQFLWLAITLGALSLLTPCVFPMIPITVSYFTNHASHSRAKAVRLASVYSFGIIATFTILGMLLAIFVGAAGINLFAANPYVNIVIAAVFLFFAFNLFGAYELQVPSSLLNRLDSLTRTKEGEGSGIVGALLMGLTFTLTSFTCTSPFVGTILVSASQGSWKMPLVGMLAYSTVFALPFFVLALVPQLMSQLPRAGGWMNSVKVTMGFLEVAAAMKFISNVDLIWKWGIFTRSFVLAIWIAIFAVLAVYLLGKFQMFHDSKPEKIGAVRLIAAILSLAVSFYLLTGLFGAKIGSLESFLPPDLNVSASSVFGGRSKDEPKWIENDLERAIAQAKAENKKVFVDFTGYTCTNCRWMEANVFPEKAVEAEMSKYVLARLYTDGDGEVYERQQQYQELNFKTVALPYYAVLDGDGKTVGTFPGLTRNVEEFVGFLKAPKRN